MNNSEILIAVEDIARIKEVDRETQGGSINPELSAMAEILPTLSPRAAIFLRKRMALDIKYFQEHRIRKEDFPAWQTINKEASDYLPKVPEQIHPLPRAWKEVFSDVVRLYGNPHGE